MEAGKTTDSDKQVISALEKKISVDRSRLFQDLIYAKTQVSGLSESQILRKDLKIIGGIPVCGLPMLVEEFLKRPSIEEVLLNFLKPRNYSPVMMLMGVKINGEMIDKDLAVVSTQDQMADKVIDALVNFNNPSLGLKEITDHKIRYVKLFSQSNIRMSRKQISPIIQKVNSSIKEVGSVENDQGASPPMEN